MNELIDIRRNSIRNTLMTSVAVISVLAAILSAETAVAEEDERPTVWLEIGGQLEHLSDRTTKFAPPFISLVDESVFSSPLAAQQPIRNAFGGEAAVTFEPKAGAWQFMASVRYGRSNGKGHFHQQTRPAYAHLSVTTGSGYHTSNPVPPRASRFWESASSSAERHLLLDFSVGRDVGLGAFGASGTSTIRAGLRFGQFTSRSSANMYADPDFAFSYKYFPTGGGGHAKLVNQTWQLFGATESATRSFSGAGPSLMWDAHAGVLGTSREGLFVDWGANASLLFGRQKASIHHQTSNRYVPVSGYLHSGYKTSHHTTRARSVVVPNLGGFAGLSLNYRNAKVSVGYRADFFFGAMDGGIDTRSTYNRAFYGPFATMSIGLGG